MSQDPIRFRLITYLIIFATVVAGGMVGFKYIENKSWVDAFYFIIVTMATVGYGDVTPVTATGKFFAVVLIVLGVTTFLGVFANAAELALSRREKQVRMRKLNMVIGVFFSEVGTRLIRDFSAADPNFEEIRRGMIVSDKWTRQDFMSVSRHLRAFRFGIEISYINLASLKEFLLTKRDFLVRLLENPILLDHESFTDLLRAVFHLAEELAYREKLTELPSTDRAHIAGDTVRAYNLLVHQWLDYMEYLKTNYPYLFSLAMRTNPFDRQASPICV
jgi:voltage-gated potassium channel Kch